MAVDLNLKLLSQVPTILQVITDMPLKGQHIVGKTKAKKFQFNNVRKEVGI